MSGSNRANSDMPSFTEAVYKAKKVGSLKDLRFHTTYRIGDCVRHRVPRPLDLEFYANIDDLMASIVEEAHLTVVYLYSILDPRLYRIYKLDNELGGKADPNWAWRPGIWWTFCEHCETLWTMPYENGSPLGITEIFPLHYWPNERILATIQNWLQIMWNDWAYADVIRKMRRP